MRTSIRSSGKVHFPARFPFSRRKSRLRRLRPRFLSRPKGARPCSLSEEDRTFLESLRPWARALARRSGLTGTDIEDAVQSALLRAFVTWFPFIPPPGVPERSARRAWFAIIVWSVATRVRHRVRRERALHVPEADFPLRDRTASPESRMIAGEALRELQQCTTPERWRAWKAYRIDGVAVQEIARLEGRPVPTIYNLVRLARKDFTSALRREAKGAAGVLTNRRGRDNS